MTPSATIQLPAAAETLRANLAAFGKLNADVARAIADAPRHVGLSVEQTPDGVPAAVLDGVPLCSRRRPIEEARRLVESIDLIEHAVIVVLGFGMGYHVAELARRTGRQGVIVVFEPDVAVLWAAFEHVDHRSWLRDSLVVFVTDPDDRAAVNAKLQGAEAIIAQGVEFLEHPPSRARLAEPARRFATVFREYVTSAKLTLVTTLLRSVDTVRNLILNLDHYAAGSGIADLHNLCKGRLGIVVSAGPSLHRNIHQLAMPGVRDRCVIVAVQTTLRPLLEAGIKPHFVTALDYHEISRRFYEGLEGYDLSDVTLIADPKANPVILDSFPGPVRCCCSPYLDKLLGDAKREMGSLPAGATVAHLAVYVARYLGCDPIALIGQDLGFTDGLYYAPSAAIHDVWATELNPFNTIEMMEWQRIVRHRVHLHQAIDVHGRSILTDTQMVTYLQQFERDFAAYRAQGHTIIDATEGGVRKQHTDIESLDSVLARLASPAVAKNPAIPLPARTLDPARIRLAQQRLRAVKRDVASLRDTSRETGGIIEAMLREQSDRARMDRHFARIEKNRAEVERRFESFELLNHMNQLGAFRRTRADRRMAMQQALDPVARQRAQLDRDLDSVTWLADAATEMLGQLDDAQALLEGRPPTPRPSTPVRAFDLESTHSAAPSRVAALIPVDLALSGSGLRRSLEERFDGRSVLQATLERLGQCASLQSIILLTEDAAGVERLIDRSRIGLPVVIEACPDSPFSPEHRAVVAARAFAPTCWRGGISGMAAYDEVLCPQAMHQAMLRHGLTAALLVGPDWPLVDVSAESGCAAIIARHLEQPDKHNLVFTQAPPGIGSCLISASLMAELAQRNRLSTVGGLLVYQPHAPQGDPIARDANVQISHHVRSAMMRATFDSPHQRELLSKAVCAESSAIGLDAAAVVAALQSASSVTLRELPQHLILDINTDRASTGLLSRSLSAPARSAMDLALARRIFDQLAASPDAVLTLGHIGDPLLHPQFDAIITAAKNAGILAVHVRTELPGDRSVLDRLLRSGVDVISVELHADRAQTAAAMLGDDDLARRMVALEYLTEHRTALTPQDGTAAMGVPWIVPRIIRCEETYEDIEPFFERWQHLFGCAVIEGLPYRPDMAQAASDIESATAGKGNGGGIAQAVTPARVHLHELHKRMVVFSDGEVPLVEHDLGGLTSLGNVRDQSLAVLWSMLLNRRHAIRREQGIDVPELKMFRP